MSTVDGTPAAEQRPGCGDSRRLRKTKTPGVFKRIGGDGQVIGYVVVFRVAGKQRKRHARTYDEARRIKRESETDRDRGELQERTTITFLRYLDEWIERYRGQGRRGFRENTRDEYRRLIANYPRRYFSGRLKLVDVTTYRLARFVDWLADPDEQGKRLGDATIANIVIPLRAALATAKREGLIRHNPAQGLSLPHRDQVIDPEQEIKVFSREQLAAVLAIARPGTASCSSCWRRPACGSARRSPSNASTYNSTVPSPRSAYAERSSASGSSRPRRSTAAATCSSRNRSSRGYASISQSKSTRTRPRLSSRTRPAAWSTPTISAAVSSSRSSKRSTPPGLASTPSATPSPPSISATAPTCSNSAARSATTPLRSRSRATPTCCRARRRHRSAWIASGAVVRTGCRSVVVRASDSEDKVAAVITAAADRV